ncbi:MAG: ion channel [Marmoricola sp.]
MNAFARVTKHPSAILLGVQLLSVMAYPFMEDTAVGRAAFGVLGVVVLGVAVWAVRASPALTWVAGLLGVPVVVLTILEGMWPHNSDIHLVSGILHAAFYAYTAYAMLRYLLADTRITADELFAVGAAFTVVAWFFAYVYGVVQILAPGSFTAYANPAEPRSWMELLFLSFTVLTSTGLSDVTPVLGHARAVVMLEQVTGLMYVALVVSRAVGLTLNPAVRAAEHSAGNDND